MRNSYTLYMMSDRGIKFSVKDSKTRCRRHSKEEKKKQKREWKERRRQEKKRNKRAARTEKKDVISVPKTASVQRNNNYATAGIVDREYVRERGIESLEAARKETTDVIDVVEVGRFPEKPEQYGNSQDW